MNCVPVQEGRISGGAADSVLPSARAALLFGKASPKPQPCRSWATMAPSHFPLVKPQQPEAQMESLWQGPVMNCVPVAVVRRGTGGMV